MGVITINNYSITGDCSNSGLGQVFFNITGDSPGWAVSEISTSGLLPTSATTSVYQVNNLPAGSYFVEITDSAFDVEIVPVYISSGTCVSLNVEGTFCGANNGSITATTQSVYGTADFYLYNISNNLYSSAIGVPNNYIFNGLSADTYYVIANDGGGCSGRSESCIIYSSTPIDYGFYVVNDSNCVSAAGNGKIFITGLTGNAPFTYLWSNGETSSSVENLLPGVYSVTVTDSNGCQLIKTVTVNNVPPIQFGSFITTPPSCFTNDGEVSVTVVNGTAPYYFSGSNGQTIVTYSQTYTFTNLNPGNFSVFVQDAGLCSVTNSTTLSTPNSFSITSVNTVNSSCGSNGSVNIVLNNSVAGGTFTYTLTDSFGNTNSQTTGLVNFSFNNLVSGTYTLTITDGTCTYNTTITITNTVLFTISAVTTGTTCGLNNGSVKIIASPGGALPYTYQITGQPPSSQTQFNNLASGTYTTTVTDNNGCSQTKTFNISPSSGVFFDFLTTQPTTGNNGEIEVLIYNGEPPFTYSWSPNVGPQTGLLVTGLSPGTYTLQVTDSDGCIYSKSTTLQGTSLVSSYQVFNICDSNFQNTNLTGKRGILQMYNEGFYDLTFEDTNCIINSAEFALEITVNGELNTVVFYTSTGIDDYPSDEEWITALVDELETFEGIGDVIIDEEKNTIQIFNSCISGTTCNPSNTNLLSDANVIVNLVIDYDISCDYCGLPPPPCDTCNQTPLDFILDRFLYNEVICDTCDQTPLDFILNNFLYEGIA